MTHTKDYLLQIVIYILPDIRNEQASWSLLKSVKCQNRFHADKKIK